MKNYSFNFIDHTADIALEIYGKTLNDLFTAAAFGFKEAVIKVNKESSNERKSIELKEASLEELLAGFIDELNFLLQTKRWLFSSVDNLEIISKENHYYLTAELSGGELLENQFDLLEEIKAVTFHQMEISEKNKSYFTRLVFDI
jgi:SHS2 domain-containing protein